MSSTSAEALSIQAVSPRSIFDPAGAGEAGAAGAALLGGAAGCWARTARAVPPSTSSVSRTRVSRFTRVSLCCRRRALRPAVGESKRGLISLARADADRRLHRRHEDLAVADVAGLGRGRHDLGHLVHELVGYDDLDLDLREEVHRVLAAPIQLRVALLAAETAHLGDGHADHADAGERLLDVVQLERLDDRLDLLHQVLPIGNVRATDVPRPPGLKRAISEDWAQPAGLTAAQISGSGPAPAQASGGGTARTATGGAAGCCACASSNRAWDGASPGARPRPACSTAWIRALW